MPFVSLLTLDYAFTHRSKHVTQHYLELWYQLFIYNKIAHKKFCVLYDKIFENSFNLQ
jgi:hypothetical protein